MKKLLFILSISFIFIIFANNKVQASNQKKGTCIIKQQNTTYEVHTPFYWYEVVQESLYDDLLNNTLNYWHNNTLIETKAQCLELNKIAPTYEQPYKNNYLSNKTTNYHFSESLLTDSKSIYQYSLQTFQTPDLVIKDGFEISSTYISFDNAPPIIANDKIDSIIIANVNQKIDIENIKSKITAYDENDGLIDVKIHEDNYSSNYTILGTYSLTFSASDNSENTSYLTIDIKVIDTIKPTISGQKNINSYMSNPLTTDQIKGTIKITDNYDKNLNNLKITLDDYTSNITKEGTFTITLVALDNSNNESLPFSIKITMIDDIPPVIEGETAYKVNIKNKLNISTILNKLSLKDNTDSSPTIEIENDTYTPSFYKIGVYQISFVAKDKNNNQTAPFTINVITEDTEAPIFYISQKFIAVDSSFQIPVEELITLVSESNNIDKQYLSKITILENNYSDNYSNKGTYKLKIKYENELSNEIIIESNIIVDSYSKEQTKNTPKKSFWSAIRQLFIKIYKSIKKIFSFFKRLI